MSIFYKSILAVLIIVIACNEKSDAAATGRYAALQVLDTAQIRIITARDTVVVSAELAESAAEHGLGLMERRELNADAGMLFLYGAPQSESAGYWMFRT